MGLGPFGSSRIDPGRGAVTQDIFYHYKVALHTAYAEEATDRENEQCIKAGLEPYTEPEYAERVGWHLRRLPYKLVKARYHSFQRYFHWLKQLQWVEASGEEERSTVQEMTGDHPDTHPRKLYRLTRKGMEASDEDWSHPQRVLYPLIGDMPIEDYIKEKSQGQKYYRRKGGRFLRPFTAGQFLRDYFLGLGPEDSPKIDPKRATMASISSSTTKKPCAGLTLKTRSPGRMSGGYKRKKHRTLRRNTPRAWNGIWKGYLINYTAPAFTASITISTI